jgi:putative ABC transport system substrate-binding protein
MTTGKVTNRRACLRFIAAVVALAPTAAHAQRLAKNHRVGVLMTTTPAAASHVVAAFAEAMRERGHVEGRNVTFEYRWAEGRPEKFPELAADLVQQKVDVIVASSQGPALAAKRATATIPIVMVNVTDPVGVGLVASLARPGGNVTGLSQQLTADIRAKQLQLLKEALPKVSRVVVLHSVATTVGLTEYATAGQVLGLRVQFMEVRGREDLERAFPAMARERADALLVPGDTLLFAERQRVAALAREHRLPGIYSLREFTEAGGLMSYSARLTEQFGRAAVYVDRILRGASPATLPVESPNQYELVINMNTARALALTIPTAFLLRADQVIE